MLQTQRLILRPWEEADLERWVELFANPGFMRFSGVPYYSREKTAAVVHKILEWNKTGQPSQFAVIIDETIAGFCGFLHQEVDGQKEIEIAYRLHPDFWSRGIGTEAARAVRDHAFRDLQLSRVISIIHPDNAPSRRVAEKNGMRIEKEAMFKGFPSLVYAISRNAWLTQLSSRAKSRDPVA
jgi:ribosomal-protein-alanine N-acetyltransferase